MTDLNILLSSGGRRIALMECLRQGLLDKGLTGKLMVADSSTDAPAVHLADEAWRVPRCTEPGFVEEVLKVTSENRVGLLIPTIDDELLIYAENRTAFATGGTDVAISDPATVRICRDKSLTHNWLLDHGFPTVRQSSPEAVLRQPEQWTLPLIVKPRAGSASKGVRLIRSLAELRVVAELEDSLIVQEVAPGVEYTINLFVNRCGKCVCAVPHQRMEVRSGEVSKAVTSKDPNLMRLACSIAEALPGARGMLNIQCFRSVLDHIRVIEINARVGGGYPVAHSAGARFTHWIIEEHLDMPSTAAFDNWQDDWAMLRYDQAIFTSGASIRGAKRQNEPLATYCANGSSSD